MCNHEHGTLVSSGVDEHGEWRSLECDDCGKVWLTRKKGNQMKVNGYEIGEEPTREEWRIYEKVKAFGQRETAAQYLGDCGRLARPVSQQAFEEFVARLGAYIEHYNEAVTSKGHALVAKYDRKVEGDGGMSLSYQEATPVLEEANARIADMLREQTDKTLDDVLLTASLGMRNAFALSDH